MMIKNSNDESEKLGSYGQENGEDETNIFASHVKVHTNRFV